MELIEVLLSDIKETTVRPDKARQKSLAAIGMKEPVVLRRNCTGFEIIAGNRRIADLRAIQAEKVTAIVGEWDDVEARLRSLVSNASRSPNPMHEAWDIAFFLAQGYLEEQIAEMIGRTQGYVSQRRSLVEKLIEPFQHRLERGEITFTTARILSTLRPEQQEQFLDEGTVTEDMVKGFKRKAKSRSINLAGLDDDIPDLPEYQGLPGQFISGQDMAKALTGQVVVVEWQGRKFEVRLL